MKYWIDSNAGVVVCKMNEREDIEHKSPVMHAAEYVLGKLTNGVMSCAGGSSDNKLWIRTALMTMVMPLAHKYIKDEYVGKSKLSPDDDWDEEVGVELARARCLEDFYYDVHVFSAEVSGLLEHLCRISEDRSESAYCSMSYWVDRETEICE